MLVKRGFFVLVAVAMLALTAAACLRGGVAGAGELFASAWGRLTVFDAYFAILTVYLLTAARERKGWLRLVWLALYVTLGSFAIAMYMLFRFPAAESPRVE